jgi:hypothetical protein
VGGVLLEEGEETLEVSVSLECKGLALRPILPELDGWEGLDIDSWNLVGLG